MPIPAHFRLIEARAVFADLLFDVYAFDDDGVPTLGAVCAPGTKDDLFDILCDSARDHFTQLVENYEPAREARFERGMERAAARLLDCPAEFV